MTRPLRPDLARWLEGYQARARGLAVTEEVAEADAARRILEQTVPMTVGEWRAPVLEPADMRQAIERAQQRLEAATALFSFGPRFLDEPVPPREPPLTPLAVDDATQRSIHGTEGEGGPASPPESLANSQGSVRPLPACRAKGSDGHHRVPTGDGPTSCPCGAVKRIPPRPAPRARCPWCYGTDGQHYPHCHRRQEPRP